MTAGLETFAKVRALHDRTTNPGEKAAAAGRMEALARRLGMTVAEALSKLDKQAEKPKGPSFDDIFNNPAHQRARAERERERAEKWRAVVAEYGSEEAVFAPTPWEQALAAACDRFRVKAKTTGWSMGSLWGWDIFRPGDPAAEIAEAIASAFPMPTTVRAALAEFRAWDKLMRDREACGVGCGDPSPEAYFRMVLMERLLNTLPASTLNDLRARLDWFDYRNSLGNAPDPKEEGVRLATLRADIERMGARLREQDMAPVQNGQGGQGSAQGARPFGSPDTVDQSGVQNGQPQGCSHSEPTLRSPDPGAANPGVQTGQWQGGSDPIPPSPAEPEFYEEVVKPAPGPDPVQSGHLRRTNAAKRADVLALLNDRAGEAGAVPLTDREIARRAGVSPTTVGAIRRAQAARTVSP